jgi:acetoacetyl-CoA synthetase
MAADELWKHAAPETTAMWRFLQHVNQKFGLQFSSYEELYRWSVEETESFWGEVWQFVGVLASKQYEQVRRNQSPLALFGTLWHSWLRKSLLLPDDFDLA